MSHRSTTARLTNSLTVLAAEVKEKLALSATAERTAIEAVLAAGAALCEAKDACKHGEWLPFLDAAGVPERIAQRYMRLALWVASRPPFVGAGNFAYQMPTNIC